MLYSMKYIVDKALEGNFGVIAPSIRNEACIRSAIEAAEELDSPVIINICYDPLGNPTKEFFNHFGQVAVQYCLKTRIPCAINLDHGQNFEQCAEAVHAGFSSVMIDASVKPLDENIAITKEVVRMAHACGISVEAELGHVGAGDTSTGSGVDKISQLTSWSAMTDPEEAKIFVEKTGVDCLAVSIGNKHGPYAQKIVPHIDFELLQKIREAIPNTPLVLHGGSGTGDENLSKACTMGICKINVGTELEEGAMMAVVNQYNTTGRAKGVFENLRQGYKAQIIRHMKLFGSVGKASLY